jgi:hypothetical protein
VFRVQFWGKLEGVQRDYLIAQGLGETTGDIKEAAMKGGSEITVAHFFETLQTLPKKTFRLGPDGVSWTFLPAVTPEMKAQHGAWKASLQAQGRVFSPLTGDVSHKYEWTELTGPPAEGEEQNSPETKEMVEDVRLACMIDEIGVHCMCISVVCESIRALPVHEHSRRRLRFYVVPVSPLLV